MARSKFTPLLPEEERGEYERWLPGSHRKLIKLDELHEHPDNWELVGRIDESRKKSLVEDVKKSGIREDLQVWFRDGRLIVVSGHERMNIARELGIDELPCVKVDFKSESEARRHIFATNKHRKQVKLPPPDVMMSMFPPDEYPLMYADLRANYAYDSVSESEMSSGHITSEEREKARKKRENERKTQADLRKQAGELLGYTPEFTKQIVTKVAKKAKPQTPAAKVRELTASEIKQRERLEKKLATLWTKLQKKAEAFESLKIEISQLRKDEKKLTRELGKLS